MTQRSPKGRFSGPSNSCPLFRATRSVCLFCPSGVNGGIFPPDGKIPPLTPEGQKRQTERVARNKGHEFDGPENRPLGERCVIWASTGPPTLPTRSEERRVGKECRSRWS